MKKLVLFLPLLLAACQQPANPQQSACETERYRFEQGTPRLAEREIVVQTYGSTNELHSAYRTVKGRPLDRNEELFGFGVITKQTCTIHIIDPSVRYCPAEFGHEMTHCLYGEWHPNQNEL